MKAFTLTEVLIVVALVGTMLVVLTTFFVSANSTYEFQRSTIEQDQRVRLVVERVEHTVKGARAVVDTHLFGNELRTSSDSVLVVAVPAINGEGKIEDGYLDYIAFYRENGNVYEDIDAAPESARESGRRILVSSVAELSFEYDTAPASEVRAVTIDVVAQSLVRDQDVRGQLRQTLYLRNAP